MKKKSIVLYLLSAIIAALPFLTSCGSEQGGFVDGYYTAEVKEFDDHGWKEYITICVSGGKIVTIEYNAKNPSGMIKSWDMDYMRTMNRVAGSYPNQYTRAFASDLLENQGSGKIDMVTGATHSYHTFLQLADAVVALAAQGEEQIVFVVPEE